MALSVQSASPLVIDVCVCVCLDAAAPLWEELKEVMLAVKIVVHGLVEFTQNFSKKNHESFQVERWFSNCGTSLELCLWTKINDLNRICDFSFLGINVLSVCTA